MGLRIQTNIPSINAQQNLEKTSRSVQDSMAKLSSGERINKAADDAAGLAVSENLRADIRSLSMARRNANDGISMIQTAEGGLLETSNMLVRLRELSIQAASDTIGDRERSYLDKEFLQLKDEIDRIATSTQFNGTRLLVGTQSLPDELNAAANKFPLEIQVNKDYFSGADSVDQYNPLNIIKIDFQKLNGFTHGEGSLELGEHEDGTRVGTKSDAQRSIGVVDTAINRINEHRSYLGSVQNRLTSTVSNLGSQIENLTESRSRIKDTDFAVETANLTKSNILMQAGASILASANAQPQVALALLK
ncbi:MAG: flagellin [Oligoflexales bacterium]|nr:flagellin [Oligoflexales bacterium]